MLIAIQSFFQENIYVTFMEDVFSISVLWKSIFWQLFTIENVALSSYSATQ